MLWTLALVLLSGEVDPRVAINEAQIGERYSEALSVTEETLRERPDLARELGFDYLRGHLLRQLGRSSSAHDAFAAALNDPIFSQYSRYWLARHQADDGHPEVASGLLATLLASQPPKSLVGPAARLLAETIASGGDCRLLTERARWQLARDERRALDLTAASCALRRGDSSTAGDLLVGLIREHRMDDAARRAALHVSDHLPEISSDPEVSRLIGLTLHQHREFDRAELHLELFLDSRAARRATLQQRHEATYALARAHFWREDYLAAAGIFGGLVDPAYRAETNAKSLYQQGRSYELHGDWQTALTSFENARAADAAGSWASASILSAMRIHLRSGNEAEALSAYAALRSRADWKQLMGRGALFLASSDLVRGRTDRAGAWLTDARRSGATTPAELAYWRGRLAEADEQPDTAIGFYAIAARDGGYNPFAQAAGLRIRDEGMRPAARALGLERARSTSTAQLRDAAVLLAGDPEGPAVLAALERRLRANPPARTALDLGPVPVPEWPLWQSPIERRSADLILALGGWGPGTEAFGKYFPIANARLAYTSGHLLLQRGAVRRAVYIAEVLARNIPGDVPTTLLPEGYRKMLYPNPYEAVIRAEAKPRGVLPSLIASIIREESRFDPLALSAASARGLTQFILPTARRLAPKIGQESIGAHELHMPSVSIALGAAYVEELLDLFGGNLPAAVASYNAGERQAMLWRSYCFSRQPEEYITKIGFPETRNYVQKVLTGEAQYRELYSEVPSLETTTGGRALASASK